MNAPFFRAGRVKGMDYGMVWVMALPQRGHWAADPAQVVPQEEQVLQEEQLWPMPVMQEPLYMVQLQAEAALPLELELPLAVSAAQADCGNSGSEKNSSQTFSANSSQGGTAQKP